MVVDVLQEKHFFEISKLKKIENRRVVFYISELGTIQFHAKFIYIENMACGSEATASKSPLDVLH